MDGKELDDGLGWMVEERVVEERWQIEMALGREKWYQQVHIVWLAHDIVAGLLPTEAVLVDFFL